jgi:predicted ArsR family transcriptional regulator
MAEVTEPDEQDPVALVGALAEPSRRRLYDFIVASGGWVSRDEASSALDIERGTVAHHLDRLASDGLLEVDYQRLSGRQGPGAGRPSKLYRRSELEVGVSLPPRDYQLAGRLLAEAAERTASDGTPIVAALAQAATAEGRQIAERIRLRLRGARMGRKSARRRATLEVLAEHGFEPKQHRDGQVDLTNCPFHQLAKDHTELICGMNLCLVQAAVDEVGDTCLQARLDPEDGRCCVKLYPT